MVHCGKDVSHLAGVGTNREVSCSVGGRGGGGGGGGVCTMAGMSVTWLVSAPTVR